MFGGERLPTSLLVLLVVVAVLKNPVLLVVVAVPGVAAHLLAARDTIGSAGLLLFVAIYWMLLSGTWLLTGVAATFGGVIASLVTGDLWPLPVVLVAGSLVGWLATLVCFGTMVHPR